uniref:Putative ovule protein n=1 Tax=Solanum chacoense TaxID=4108 RepID=A0A0V0H8Z8_SOLCH
MCGVSLIELPGLFFGTSDEALPFSFPFSLFFGTSDGGFEVKSSSSSSSTSSSARAVSNTASFDGICKSAISLSDGEIF